MSEKLMMLDCNDMGNLPSVLKRTHWISSSSFRFSLPLTLRKLRPIHVRASH